MITNSKQSWSVGATVKVGFLTLKVVGVRLTSDDYYPDVYTLVSDKGVYYEFTPHYGLERIS